jgi:hypothetical protein
MNKLQITNLQNKTKLIFVLLLSSIFATPKGQALLTSYSLLAKQIYAQEAINLSVTPPLFELTIAPDKEVRQIFSLINSGSDVYITPKIVYFVPSDEFGNVEITDTKSPDWIKYDNSKVFLKQDAKLDLNVVFFPPPDLPETDHFLTIVFEAENDNLDTNDNLDELDENKNSSEYTTQIASNILVTVSKDGNPKKAAEIIKFSTVKIADSLLTPVSYELVIKNVGNSFWKPNGKIVTNNQTLKLAPQNILSNYSRKISCIEAETLVPCKLDGKPFIGLVKANLEFTTDEDPKLYRAEVKTFVFPFSVLVIFSASLLTLLRYKFIFKLWRRRD